MQTTQKSLSCNGSPNDSQKTSESHKIACRRQLCVGRSQSNSPASISTPARAPPFRSPRSGDHKLSRSPASEKHLNRITALETQISVLVQDLKKTKHLLATSHQEVEESKAKIIEMSSELEIAERRLKEQSDLEDERIRELRKIGHERDKAWQSELEAIRKQHTIESTALLSAVNELERLRIHCDMLVASEAEHAGLLQSAKLELCRLNQELAGKDSLVDALREKVAEFEKSEARYQESINLIHLQLEMSKNLVTDHHVDGSRNVDRKMEDFIAKAKSLEEIEGKLVDGEGGSKLEPHLSKVAKVASFNEATETARMECLYGETKLEKELKEARLEIAELKEILYLKKGGKCQLDPIETGLGEVPVPPRSPHPSEDGVNVVGANETTKKMVLVEESTTDQLKVAQNLNSEMEVELQKVRVQAQQWRKAAEVAAAIIASGGDGMVVEKMGKHCEEEKRNANVLKKIGILLKKGQR